MYHAQELIYRSAVNADALQAIACRGSLARSIFKPGLIPACVNWLGFVHNGATVHALAVAVIIIDLLLWRYRRHLGKTKLLGFAFSSTDQIRLVKSTHLLHF